MRAYTGMLVIRSQQVPTPAIMALFRRVIQSADVENRLPGKQRRTKHDRVGSRPALPVEGGRPGTMHYKRRRSREDIGVRQGTLFTAAARGRRKEGDLA